MFIPLFTRPTKRGMCIIDWEEWLEVKKRKPKLYQLYLPLYYLLFTYYFIYILSKNTRVYEKGLIKKTIQFYILWHKEIFIDYQDKRAIIELNVNIIVMREMSFFFWTFQISCHNEPLYFQNTILKCTHILTYVYIRVITSIKNIFLIFKLISI